MIRIVLFLLGVLLMALATIWPYLWRSEGRDWPGDVVVFRLGLLLAIGAAHWPSGLL